ncbi:hypothetical protein [Rhodohalobacter sp. 8-1]|uniref:hypothetical protein n=1 Tax=Rhodohalobacter sp. 8-1 TaxID=3131972 RepID=UPI0030EC6B7E
MPKLNGLVFWLIPSELFAQFYRKEIERFSLRFKTTKFVPHLTLGHLDNGSVQEIKSGSLKSFLSADGDLIKAIHSHPECRTEPYQNLIHVLNGSDQIEQFQSELKNLVPGYQPKEEYHISLMYGEIPCRALVHEINNLSKRLPEKVSFSKINLIELSGQPGSWKTLWEHKFINRKE